MELLTFIVVSAAIIIVPGPNVLVIVSTSIAHGLRRGLQTVAGTSLAMVVQLSIAALATTSFITQQDQLRSSRHSKQKQGFIRCLSSGWKWERNRVCCPVNTHHISAPSEEPDTGPDMTRVSRTGHLHRTKARTGEKRVLRALRESLVAMKAPSTSSSTKWQRKTGEPVPSAPTNIPNKLSLGHSFLGERNQ